MTIVDTTTKTVANGTIDISDLNVQPLYEGADIRIWVGKKTTDEDIEYKMFPNITGSTVSVGEFFSNGDKLCVRYIKSINTDETFSVSANFIPDTMQKEEECYIGWGTQ